MLSGGKPFDNEIVQAYTVKNDVLNSTLLLTVMFSGVLTCTSVFTNTPLTHH